MSRQPPAPVRYVILIAAIACLFGAVCARSQNNATTTPPPSNEPPPAAAIDAGPSPQQAPEPEFFPATKAPGFLIKKGGGGGR